MDDPFDDDDIDDLDGGDWFPPMKIYALKSVPRLRLQGKDKNVGKWKVIFIKK